MENEEKVVGKGHQNESLILSRDYLWRKLLSIQSAPELFVFCALFLSNPSPIIGNASH